VLDYIMERGVIRKPRKISKLKQTDIGKLKEFVDNLSKEQWDEWNLRQKNFFVHKNTKSYPVIWSDNNIVNNCLNIYRKPDKLDILNCELDYLCKKYKGRVVKCVFANLPAHSEIIKHWDSASSLICSHRLHLPIKTNSEVDFYIEDKSYSLKEGVWYEINNQKNHSVINKSSMDRVHLMVDILPNHLNIITNNFCL